MKKVGLPIRSNDTSFITPVTWIDLLESLNLSLFILFFPQLLHFSCFGFWGLFVDSREDPHCFYLKAHYKTLEKLLEVQVAINFKKFLPFYRYSELS